MNIFVAYSEAQPLCNYQDISWVWSSNWILPLWSSFSCNYHFYWFLFPSFWTSCNNTVLVRKNILLMNTSISTMEYFIVFPIHDKHWVRSICGILPTFLGKSYRKKQRVEYAINTWNFVCQKEYHVMQLYWNFLQDGLSTIWVWNETTNPLFIGHKVNRCQ